MIGPETYGNCKERILEGVKCNLDRQSMGEASAEEQKEREKLMNKLASSPSHSDGGMKREVRISI